MKAKRDMSEREFSRWMAKLGWKPQGFLGYWQGPRSGVEVSALNWATRRAAADGMEADDKRFAARDAERREANR